MESDEQRENCYLLNEQGFPVHVRRVGLADERVFGGWSDVSQYIDEGQSKGVSAGLQLATCVETTTGKRLAISGLVAAEVVPYLSLYAAATADYTRGYLFRGEFQDQPAVVIEAFSFIKSVSNECERKRMQELRRKSREQSDG